MEQTEMYAELNDNMNSRFKSHVTIARNIWLNTTVEQRERFIHWLVDTGIVQTEAEAWEHIEELIFKDDDTPRII